MGALGGDRGRDLEDGGGQAGLRECPGGGLVTLAVRALAPAPSNEEIVSFTNFHRLGLGLPLHPFVRGLLFFYGLCLHDLTSEGILHIATITMLCEAFLGIAPYWRFLTRIKYRQHLHKNPPKQSR
jgi:hypothetical protein